MSTYEQVMRYLMDRGVSRFWASTAAGWVRDGMSGNQFYCRNARNPRCTIKGGLVRRVAVTVDIIAPDSNSESVGRVVYTFNPNRTMAHRVKLSA